MSLQIASPFQQFFDRDGSPLDNGFVYVGTANMNPETNPLTVYFDDALTIPAAQPLRTSNGYIVRNGSPARIYTSQEDFALTVREKSGALVFTVPDATSLENLATQLAEGSGSSLIGYNQGDFGAVDRTVENRLQDIVSVKDFGAVGDGVADDTAALQNTFDAAYDSGAMILIPAGKYLISADLEVKRSVYSTGPVEIFSTRATDTPTNIGIYISRRMELENFTFNYVNVYTTVPSGSELLLSPVSFKNCSFVTNFLQIGESTLISSGYEVIDCNFANRGSRFTPAIKVLNASNIAIERNNFQEYSQTIEVEPTLSLSTSNIVIRDNKFSNSNFAIALNGTSMHRISMVTIENNVISSTTRDAGSNTVGQVDARYCCNLNILENDMAHRGAGITLNSVLDCTIQGNTISGNTNGANLRTNGCINLNVIENTFNNYVVPASYCILVLPKSTNFLYDSQKVLIEGNRLTGTSLGIKIEGVDDVQVVGNQITALSAISANSLLWFTSDVTRGYYSDNRFYAPSGTAVKNDAGANVTSTASAQTTVTTTVPATSVAAPIITASDASLNNAKSYVVTFTIGHASKMVHLIDDTNKKTLSNWMIGVVGATLAWNASAWSTVDGKLPDIVQNGCVFDNFDTETYGSAGIRKSMMFIDRYNKLTCRNFNYAADTQNAPNNLGAVQIAEHAYNTATFRPPLVVDGAVYDAVGNGIIDNNGYAVQLSGRMALGQKLDGTYVLLCVDGQTNVSGCTIEQVANKMLTLGCQNAFNLDGGGSTTLWYSGSVINSPSDPGGERPIPSVLYV